MPVLRNLGNAQIWSIVMADTRLHHFQQFCLRESQFFNHIPHWSANHPHTGWFFSGLRGILHSPQFRRHWCHDGKEEGGGTPEKSHCCDANERHSAIFVPGRLLAAEIQKIVHGMVWYGMGHLFLNCDFAYKPFFNKPQPYVMISKSNIRNGVHQNLSGSIPKFWTQIPKLNDSITMYYQQKSGWCKM